MGWKSIYNLNLDNQADIDGIVVASQTIQHDIIVPQIVGIGKPIFVEKPLAASIDQATILQNYFGPEQAFHTGRLLYQYDAALDMQTKIKNGDFGEVQLINISYSHDGLKKGWFKDYPWMTDRHKAGVGGFGDLGILAVGLAYDLTKEQLSKVAAKISKLPNFTTDVPDHYGTALMLTQSGTQINIYVGWAEDPNFVGVRNPTGSLFMLEVVGTKGKAFFTTGNEDGFFFSKETGQQTPIAHKSNGAEGSLVVFIDSVRNGLPANSESLSKAVGDIAVLGKLYEASALGRDIKLKPLYTAQERSGSTNSYQTLRF